jgi:hypothetical protein
VLDDVVLAARFLRRLPGFLRTPVTVATARRELRRRLECRAGDFLAIARRAIYEHPESPYRDLLRHAGCEYGDLDRLVTRAGVEGALGVLWRSGVFLSMDEFKGRRPVVRGGTTIAVDPHRLRNPGVAGHAWLQTGGSRGSAASVAFDLGFVRDRAVTAAAVFDAWGGTGWRRAVWGVPGGAAMIHALEFSVLEASFARWFSTLEPGAPGLHPRYRWSARALRWGSLVAGRPVPAPLHVPLDEPLTVARWMAGVLRGGRVPHLHAFASAAARLCEAAIAADVDLAGARFTMAGEPTTAARLDAVRRVGADAIPYYASVDSGPIGYGCIAPETPDDLHLLRDFQAVIQSGPANPGVGLPPNALLLSSLRDSAPFVLLNVSLGDQATVVKRRCECPLERLGFSTHLHTVRSFEKLTAGGMSFLDVDLVRVLEDILPRRFGGGSTDYQLVEDETPAGQPRLLLFVHPAVGSVDEAALAEAFLAGIGRGPGAERVMAMAWRDARLLRIERRPPRATAAGKIQHLHVVRSPLGTPR